MDRYERAALLDFVSTIVWPTRTVITAPGGVASFDVNGTWDVAQDTAMAWVNGNRLSAAVTWVSPSRITLPVTPANGAQIIIFITPGTGTGYLPRSGLSAMLGKLDMGGQRITSLGASVTPHPDDAVRRDEVAAITNAIVGGNFVAKAGDQMEGRLLLVEAALLTAAYPSAALRRDMAMLHNGTVDFTGKPHGPSTITADTPTTLTTKDWVEAYVAEQLANTQAPNHELVFATPGTGYTFKIGTDCASTVRKLWIFTKGGKGADGGGVQPPGANVGTSLFSGVGVLGGQISGSLHVAADTELGITVGGNGQPGHLMGSNRPNWPAGGGGGGGGTEVVSATDSINGGGGGGGGGFGDNDHSGGTGGAGGMPGKAGSGAGGVAGNTITKAGGIGGARGTPAHKDGGDGSEGSGIATAGFNTSDSFPFQSITDPNLATGVGLVIIKWYEV